MEKIRRVMNKENRNCYLLPLPCWITRFIPHLHVTPQELIVKPGKNDSDLWPGSAKAPNQDMNSIQIMKSFSGMMMLLEPLSYANCIQILL
eukprot:13026027-Ditylum_brightwellii.AAC.1